jgi:putative SOS response-associated peptidase YedK
MCGSYRLSRRKQIIEEHFDSVSGEEEWTPRYNIAPTQPIPVIRQHPKEPVRQLSLMKWGLIPPWAKDSSGAAGMINARSETAGTKPAKIEAISDLLKPCDARLMRCYPVSTRVNSVANDDEGCSASVEPAQTQARLFS